MGSLAGDHRAQGNECFARRDYAGATQRYTAALYNASDLDRGRDPSERLLLLNNRALAHFRSGAFEVALADALAALALDGVSDKARYRAALSHMALDQASSAASHLAALAACPASPDVAPLLSRATALSRHQHLVQTTISGEYICDEDDQHLRATQKALAALWAEAEGDADADADVGAALLALEASLRGSEAARAWFAAQKGYRLIWFLFTEAHCEAAAAVLRAAATPAVLWPRDAWARLLAAAVAPREDTTGAAAMELVAWAAEASPAWVKCQLLAAPLGGGEAAASQPPLATILGALAAEKLGAARTTATVALLELYGADAAGAAALRAAGAAPLQALLSAVSGAEAMCEGMAEDDMGQGVSDLPAEEAEALRALREKRRAVYDAAAVGLRRRLLCVLHSLCAHRELVLQEALVRGPGGKVGEGRLVGATLRLLGDLLDASPRRTAPVLGPDGSVASYGKRPFAADWKDNPAGDFLATLDLGGSGSGGSGSGGGADSAVERGPTQLELLVDAVELICASSAAVATAAHRRGAVGAAARLAEFLTPSVSGAGRRIAAVLAQKCAKALEEVLGGDSVALVVGLAVHLPADLPEARARAFDKLAGVVHSCSGDEFAGMTGPDGALQAALAAAAEGGPTAPAGARLLRLCADRALRRGRAGQTGKVPRGGGWDALDGKALLGVLSPAAPKAGDGGGLEKLKKGFLPAKSETTATKPMAGGVALPPRRPQAAAAPATPAPQPSPRISRYRGGVVIEELDDEDTAEQRDSPAPAAAQQRAEQNAAATATAADAALPDLRTMFDSSPTDAAVRRSRSAWLALLPARRLRWEQTGANVSVWVAAPAGTAAADVAVRVTPGSLSVQLKWYGTVVEGRLRGRVKAGEAAWCLEAAPQAAEVHVVLPKDGAGAWWKALLEGNPEKGYLDLLREAVEADDAGVAAAAAEGPEARELAEALRERQALVAAGMVDLEGVFDDFRIALGEESLRGGGGGGSAGTR